MNKKPTLPESGKKDEDEVDLSNLGPDNAPELTPEMAKQRAPLGRVDPEFAEFIRKGGRPLCPRYRKRRVTIMLDPDVIEHFKAGGKGWQTRMNEALRKAAGL